MLVTLPNVEKFNLPANNGLVILSVATSTLSLSISMPTAAGPMPIAAIINGTRYAVHSDHLNTPRRITAANGTVLWQWSYSGFGEDEPTTAAKRFTSPTTNPTTGTTSSTAITYNLRFPGQVADRESGLFYNYFRTYDPRVGRYSQNDPIGLLGGPNRFTYVRGNAFKYVDPLGLAEYLGLGTIESHLRWLAGLQGADFDTDPFDAANTDMLARLRRGEESEWDIAFYRHEMAEAEMCRPARKMPANEAVRWQTDAHKRVLQNQKNREKDLYHPDVVFKNKEFFGKNWGQ
ncbi:MAG: hypothetical protein DI563_11455 [Variovorax paradoxus]|uniref:Uncharacterized protein n=1 Tax=Variovorax paradoxus TaxID=34073 RepID=A0A2W5QBK4_VARPD|nr:MAG: hypothetical protein DI563_11455 [Variovorax paradoxus]